MPVSLSLLLTALLFTGSQMETQTDIRCRRHTVAVEKLSHVENIPELEVVHMLWKPFISGLEEKVQSSKTVNFIGRSNECTRHYERICTRIPLCLDCWPVLKWQLCSLLYFAIATRHAGWKKTKIHRFWYVNCVGIVEMRRTGFAKTLEGSDSSKVKFIKL